MKGTPSPRFRGGQFPFMEYLPWERATRKQTVIFFDVDDTLINQRKAEAQAVRQLLDLYGSRCERPQSLFQACREWRELREKHNGAFFAGEISLQEQRRRRVREFFARRHKILSPCEVDLFFAYYEYHYRKNWSLFDDVFPFFRSLRGYTCGIITNGSTAQQRLKLERTGIARYFEVIVIAEEVGVAKPERDIFRVACERAGCPATSCIYVGDSLERDALASRAAGLRPIWLDREHAYTVPPVETVASLHELYCRLRNGTAQ